MPPTQSPLFEDTAVECAICLAPLVEHQTITLSCGHKWHLHCLQAQLQHSQPNPARRLLFSGTRCAKCKTFCDHPALNSLTRHTALLRTQVDQILTDQIQAHSLTTHPSVTVSTSPHFNNALSFARSHFAIYLCSACEQPYFGGTVACADEDDRDLPPDDRLCHRCTPRTSAICTHATHTAFHVWKCRFCCRPATHVCYGSTHMCDSCHSRDDGGRIRPPTIACESHPICSTPLPPGQDRHVNGEDSSCEQLLFCAWCRSDPLADGVSPDDRGSANLVFNPSGARGLLGWTSLSGMGWNVERSGFPFLTHQTNFVSSYSWCVMAQAVDLALFVRHPADVFVEVSARYLARTDCPSVFKLRAGLLDDHYVQLASYTSDELTAPADYWDRVRHIFQPTAQARYVVIEISGKDSRFWAGRFGSKVANACVRVVYDASVDPVAAETEIFLPGAMDNVSEGNVAGAGVVHAFDRGGMSGANRIGMRQMRRDGAYGNIRFDRMEEDDERWMETEDETNLVANGSGRYGLRGWALLSSGSWTPIVGDEAYFKSSHRESVLTQAVDLRRSERAEEKFVFAEGRFRAATSGGGSLRLELGILDKRFRVLKRVMGRERMVTNGTWEVERVMSEPVVGARYAVLTVVGGARATVGRRGGVLFKEGAVRVSVEDPEVGTAAAEVVEAGDASEPWPTSLMVQRVGVGAGLWGGPSSGGGGNCAIM